MWQAIGGFFQSLGAVLGIAQKRQELKNAPDVKEAAKAQDAVDTEARITKDVATGNLKNLREDLAE